MAGPLLQFLGSDPARGSWRGSVLLVTPPADGALMSAQPTMTVLDRGTEPTARLCCTYAGEAGRLHCLMSEYLPLRLVCSAAWRMIVKAAEQVATDYYTHAMLTAFLSYTGTTANVEADRLDEYSGWVFWRFELRLDLAVEERHVQYAFHADGVDSERRWTLFLCHLPPRWSSVEIPDRSLSVQWAVLWHLLLTSIADSRWYAFRSCHATARHVHTCA